VVSMSDTAGWSILRTVAADGSRAPDPRGGHTATLVEQSILIQGGQQHKGGGIFEYFSLCPFVLNTESRTWFEPRVALGLGPEKRAFHTTARVGAQLFIFGGSTNARHKGSGPVLLCDMAVFDLVRMAWDTRDIRGRHPRARNMHTAAFISSKLFVVGGFDGAESLDDTHVLDMETMLWSQPKCEGTVLPHLQAHASWVVGHRLFLLGGCSVRLDEKGHSHSKFNDEVFSLNTESMFWERVRKQGHQPVGRAFAAVVAIESFLILLGGWSGHSEKLSELATLDLDGPGSWAILQVPGHVPAGVYGHSANVVGTNIVLFGGWDGISPMNTVHVLDTSIL